MIPVPTQTRVWLAAGVADMPTPMPADRGGARDSGLRENPHVTKGGRGQLRRVLYMATIRAIRAADTPFKARYQALVARGKPTKPAIVAVMRAMIVPLNPYSPYDASFC